MYQEITRDATPIPAQNKEDMHDDSREWSLKAEACDQKHRTQPSTTTLKLIWGPFTCMV